MLIKSQNFGRRNFWKGEAGRSFKIIRESGNQNIGEGEDSRGCRCRKSVKRNTHFKIDKT